LLLIPSTLAVVGTSLLFAFVASPVILAVAACLTVVVVGVNALALIPTGQESWYTRLYNYLFGGSAGALNELNNGEQQVEHLKTTDTSQDNASESVTIDCDGVTDFEGDVLSIFELFEKEMRLVIELAL
jgi:hypothetical protein